MLRNKDKAFRKNRTFNIVNPISNSTRDGVFKLTSTTLEKYKANLYTLIFTGIGERIMEPEFGTSLKYLLFDQLTDNAYENIKKDIVEKTHLWIPEIAILGVGFGDRLEDAENNKMTIKIDFTLKSDPTMKDYIEIETGV